MKSTYDTTSGSLPLEIERKYLIACPDLAWLKAQPGSRRVEIVQTYLVSDDSCSRRLRRWCENETVLFFKTVKQKLTDLTRVEEEEQISEAEYLTLLQEADPVRHTIRKTRWCIPYENHCLEIDLYPFWRRQAVLECELESEEEPISFPPDLKIIREVSGDSRYLNSSLARTENPEALEESV